MKIFKRLLGTTVATLVLFVASQGAHAAVSLGFPGSFIGLGSQDLKTTIQNILRIVFGFLGILVIMAIIFGGFKMMTSAGDADKMGDGRKIVTAGVVGLVIVLAAYAISSFVINSLQGAVS
jgi:hypothetical protein